MHGHYLSVSSFAEMFQVIKRVVLFDGNFVSQLVTVIEVFTSCLKICETTWSFFCLLKVVVCSLLMNYSYEVFYCCCHGLKVYCWQKFQ